MELQRYRVPVSGGELTVARWGHGEPVVIAAHGITACALAWAPVGAAVADDLTLLAPDLRGRGDSGDLPGPYGMAQHADDLAAVLDAAGVDEAVVAGHSMGASVAAVFAGKHPERTRAVLLMDGGVASPGLRLPENVDIDAALQQIIGPALDRLRRHFESREQYRAFWRGHPAFVDTGADPAWLDAYADYDLTGPDGQLRSKASLEAVRADARDQLTNPAVLDAVAKISAPTVLLLAERGMFNDETPLYPEAASAQLQGHFEVIRVPGTNHYTLSLNEHGVQAVGYHLRELARGGQRDA